MLIEEPVAVLAPSALPGCLALSREAGWNQAAADWRFLFDHGTVFGVGGDRPVATAAILPYAAGGFGWIGMVLVAAAMRGRGLGTRLFRHAAEALNGAGLCPALDATPAGAPLYRRFGFVAQLGLTRWRGSGCGTPVAGPRQVAAADLPGLAALDASAFGAARPAVLGLLMGRAPALAFREADGFVLGRDGDRAVQLGPLAAPDEATTLRLLGAVLAATPGEAIIDLADRCTVAAAFLHAQGFRPERPFTRMALGRAAPFGDPARLVAAAGPELG